MKNKFSLVLGLFFAVTFSLSSCKKGPEGPAGKDGNSNVVSSSITSGNWTYDEPSWVQTFTYPAITSDILNSGAVLVYVQSASNYYQLPYTYYPSSVFSKTITYVHYLGGLKVFVTDSDLTQPNNPGSLTFKVVVIASSDLIRNPNVDLTDYKAVKSAFNIAD
jgi:hypothetical protein